MSELPDDVAAELRTRGLGDVVARQALTGGAVSAVEKLTTSTGAVLVLKRLASGPADLYPCEVEGLDAMRAAGMRAPEALAVGPGFLLLEWAGESARETDWEELARRLARMHDSTADEFGWHRDNYAGLLPQRNGRRADGHDFFVEHRMLRWLGEPACDAALDAADRAGVEQLASRLPELIAPQPPALVHGDLYSANIVADDRGRGSLIDPMVFYGWALADLAQLRTWGGIPPRFFDAYAEARPLPDDWERQSELLAIRDYLGILASGGTDPRMLAGVRALVRRYTRRTA